MAIDDSCGCENCDFVMKTDAEGRRVLRIAMDVSQACSYFSKRRVFLFPEKKKENAEERIGRALRLLKKDDYLRKDFSEYMIAEKLEKLSEYSERHRSGIEIYLADAGLLKKA